MPDSSNWDWNIGQKTVADIGDLRARYEEVRETAVSHDGEKIAAIVKDDDGSVPWVNGELWEESFEKAWCLRFLPSDRLFALVMTDDEWTVGVDGKTWEEAYEFVWNPRFSADGEVIAVQVKNGMAYSLAVGGQAWEKTFASIREFAISPNGRNVVAAVQVEPLKEGDTEKFLKGLWAAAVNDESLDGTFLNVWGPVAADDGKTAVEVRTGIREFSLMEDGSLWPDRYDMVWEPCISPSGSVLVPVRLPGGWTLAQDSKILWDRRYNQLFRVRVDPTGRRIAAVGGSDYGKWTVVVDDVPWPMTWNEAVLDPVFSSDGSRVAAAVRSDGSWTVAVDGRPWKATFEAVWDPVFGPAGDLVTARVKTNGSYALAIDGEIARRRYEMLWDPVFSPDGRRLLIRAIEDGKYVRSVVSADAA